jgi:hypothetical protein
VKPVPADAGSSAPWSCAGSAARVCSCTTGRACAPQADVAMLAARVARERVRANVGDMQYAKAGLRDRKVSDVVVAARAVMV